MKVVAVLQARVNSVRLPGKVLKPLMGEPMLWRQIERINRSSQIDKLIVATSTDSSDGRIFELCKSKGIECYRGDLNNVLDRMYRAVCAENADYIVRLTGDCPLTDHNLIDDIICNCVDNNYDYSTNALDVTYPDGLDVEVFKFQCLRDAHMEASLPSELEHVTPFIHQQPDRYNIGAYKSDVDLSYLRWTVDEQEDYELIKIIYESLYERSKDFLTSDILELYRCNPMLEQINSQYARNEGFHKSLSQDKEFLSSLSKQGE